MHVFVTGASGFVGTAVTKELIGSGHSVLALCRSKESAEKLVALGAQVERGSLQDLHVLKRAASASDGVLHLAFVHDFSNFAQSCQIDRQAITAMAEALAGSNRPLVITTGSMLLPLGRPGDENDAYDTTALSLAERGKAETLVKEFAAKGVCTSVMRLAVVNHGSNDDHMFISTLISTAREKGVSVFIGNGLNRWPAVHVLDTAVAFRLALGKGVAGSVYHAVAEEGVRMKDIAEMIGKKLGLPVVSRSMNEAMEHFGPFAAIVGADNPTLSKLTMEVLGWSPVQCTLLDDLEYGDYFE